MDKAELKYLSLKDCEKILNAEYEKYTLENVRLARDCLSEFISIVLENEKCNYLY